MKPYKGHEKTRLSNQNMSTNGTFTGRILTSLAPLESWQPQLFNGTTPVKICRVDLRILNNYFILHIFCSFQGC